MIRYYCNACGSQVRSLNDLIDLSSKKSAEVKHDYFDAGFRQEHVCTTCVHAIKHFIATLNTKPAPPTKEATEVAQVH